MAILQTVSWPKDYENSLLLADIAGIRDRTMLTSFKGDRANFVDGLGESNAQR